jgi:hypothetical protein
VPDGLGVALQVDEAAGELVVDHLVVGGLSVSDVELAERLLEVAALLEGHGQIEVRVRKVVLELEGLAIEADRQVVAVAGEEAREVVVRGGARGVGAQGVHVLVDGLQVLALLGEDGGQIVVSVGGLRVEGYRLLELADGLVEPSPIGELDAACVVLVRLTQVIVAP